MKSPYLQIEHSDDSREYTGNMLTSLWRMSDRLFAEPKEVCTCADCYQPLGTGPCIVCDSCGGSGLVPANSGSDVADRRCPECRGKGVLR